MDSNTASSVYYPVECARSDSLDLCQQSYFPPQWQDDPMTFDLDDSNLDLPVLQGQLDLDPASSLSLCQSSSSSSPSASETPRKASTDSQLGKKQDRRRAQNRAAQRAYRERKEQIRQELELQVKAWQDRHDSLRKSYVGQAQQVQRLKKQLEFLRTQLLATNGSGPHENTTFDFDMWADSAWAGN